jgi:hypothetical protein
MTRNAQIQNVTITEPLPRVRYNEEPKSTRLSELIYAGIAGTLSRFLARSFIAFD